MKQYILILSVLLLQACNSNKPNDEQAAPVASNDIRLTDKEKENAHIETGKLERRNVSSILKVNGIVDVPPQNMISVSVPLGGYLKSTQLLPGMHIAKGEVLAVLEDIQYIQLQQDYLAANAQLGFSEADFKRQQELNKNKNASDKVFEQANADYKSQKALVRALAEKLALIGIDAASLTDDNISRSIVLRSPINGYVSSVNVNVGKYINPSDVLFELVNPDDIHLTLTVFERDLYKLSIGQAVTAYTNGAIDKEYQGKILLVGKNLSASRSTEVHCHFDKYDKALVPGTYMNAEIAVLTNDATVLPEDAIVEHNGETYAFAANGKDSYEMIKVKAGIADKGYREIIVDAAMEGKEFVTKNAYTLFMKAMNKAE